MFDITCPVSSRALPLKAFVREVSLRDGLQNVRRVVSTDVKRQWLTDAYAAGVREIEVGSFVPPQLLPQMADTAEVLAFAKTFPDLETSALVPNLKGALRAFEGQVDVVVLPASASHAHSLANLRKTPREVVDEFARIRAQRDASGARTRLNGGIGTAFGCTIQGRVAHEAVLDLVRGLLDAGADSISLADTVGYADPHAVSTLFERVLRIAGDKLRGRISTTRAAWAWLTPTRRCGSAYGIWTAASRAWAAVRMRRVPVGT